MRKLPVVFNQEQQGLIRDVTQNRFINDLGCGAGKLLTQQRTIGSDFPLFCKTNDLLFPVNAGFENFYNAPGEAKKSCKSAAFPVNNRAFFIERTGFFVIQSIEFLLIQLSEKLKTTQIGFFFSWSF